MTAYDYVIRGKSNYYGGHYIQICKINSQRDIIDYSEELIDNNYLESPQLYCTNPAPFPEEIITLPILQTSKEFELVLDPFMGSGTTGRVCDNLGKSFVGYDLSNYIS